jgi:hypothetical protein
MDGLQLLGVRVITAGLAVKRPTEQRPGWRESERGVPAIGNIARAARVSCMVRSCESRSARKTPLKPRLRSGSATHSAQHGWERWWRPTARRFGQFRLSIEPSASIRSSGLMSSGRAQQSAMARHCPSRRRLDRSHAGAHSTSSKVGELDEMGRQEHHHRSSLRSIPDTLDLSRAPARSGDRAGAVGPHLVGRRQATFARRLPRGGEEPFPDSSPDLPVPG